MPNEVRQRGIKASYRTNPGAVEGLPGPVKRRDFGVGRVSGFSGANINTLPETQPLDIFCFC
jgi:hypothetical protein